MKQKRLLFLALIVILAVSSIGAGKLYRINAGQNGNFTNGRAGISFSKSYYSGSVMVTRPSRAPSGLHHAAKPLDVRFYDRSGNRMNHVMGPVYVFFNLTQSQLKEYSIGGLSIYFFDTWTNQWKACPATFVIDEETSGQRIACKIRTYGLYALAP